MVTVGKVLELYVMLLGNPSDSYRGLRGSLISRVSQLSVVIEFCEGLKILLVSSLVH